MATIRSRSRIPPLVWRLGWVSLCTDAATELLYPLIPIFLTVTLGAPVIALGLIEGMADGVATGLKAWAGIVADRVGEHRKMVRAGYALSAASKPLLGLAPNWPVFAVFRVSDRAGKAVRGVPRDLMVAEAVPPEDRGRAFGFHRAMDTSGAVIGPLVGLVALAILGEDHLRPVFLIALVPGLASLALLRSLPKTVRPSGKQWEPGTLPWRGAFGGFMAVTILFSIGNSSDAFLLLRAHDLGLSTFSVVLAYALYNVVYAALSLPAGIHSDRVGPVRVFTGGLIVFAGVYAGFAFITSSAGVWPLLAVYGAYMALTDGIVRALVVNLVPDNVRGKALGVHQAATGASVLIAGVTAGVLWDKVSHRAPFLVGASLALFAALLLPLVTRGDTVAAT
jgi:MFS family permease